MHPVTCATCHARVAVRKSSWEQTSIQWNADAVERCLERRTAAALPGPNGAGFLGCQSLAETVRDAVLCGELVVLDDCPPPVGNQTQISAGSPD